MKLYRPSTGSEGYLFENAWCQQCRHYDDGCCNTLNAAIRFHTADPEYPKAWRFNDAGEPECAEFQPTQTKPEGTD